MHATILLNASMVYKARHVRVYIDLSILEFLCHEFAFIPTNSPLTYYKIICLRPCFTRLECHAMRGCFRSNMWVSVCVCLHFIHRVQTEIITFLVFCVYGAWKRKSTKQSAEVLVYDDMNTEHIYINSNNKRNPSLFIHSVFCVYICVHDYS